ncbi:MAG: DedA family protein, partial [Deltaproteobacteria bacterium]
GAANLWLMLLVGFAGILGGDLLVYAAGRRYGGSFTRVRWLRRYFTEQKRSLVESYFERYGQGIVFLARFLPGIRVVTYFTAGAARLGLLRFLFFDALAACLSAPLWVLVGHHLGRHLQRAIHWVERAHSLLIATAALLGIGLFVYIVRRNGVAAAERTTPRPVPSPAPPIERAPAEPVERVG